MSEATTGVRVLIAEDHPLMLEAIEHRLALEPSIEIVATVGNGDELVAAYDQHRPDVVLSDLSMPDCDGIEATRRIRAADPEARVIILSAFDDQDLLASAVDAGAVGYLLKSLPADELNQRVLAAAKGEAVFDPKTTLRLLAEVRSPTRGTASPLSGREHEVLVLVAEGLSNAQIGAQLFVSPQTIKTHLEHIFTKLGVRSRTAAVKKAVDDGVL